MWNLLPDNKFYVIPIANLFHIGNKTYLFSSSVTSKQKKCCKFYWTLPKIILLFSLNIIQKQIEHYTVSIIGIL